VKLNKKRVLCTLIAIMLVYLGIDQSKAYGAEVDGQQIEKVEY